jgi:hypothetical protein
MEFDFFWEPKEKAPQFYGAYFLRDPGGGRTHDPKIKSLLLYQLSYGVKKVCKDI